MPEASLVCLSNEPHDWTSWFIESRWSRLLGTTPTVAKGPRWDALLAHWRTLNQTVCTIAINECGRGLYNEALLCLLIGAPSSQQYPGINPFDGGITVLGQYYDCVTLLAKAFRSVLDAGLPFNGSTVTQAVRAMTLACPFFERERERERERDRVTHSSSSSIALVYLHQIRMQNFQGLTGQIAFINNTGDPIAIYDVLNFRNDSDTLATIGSWNSLSGLNFSMPPEFYDGTTTPPGTDTISRSFASSLSLSLSLSLSRLR